MKKRIFITIFFLTVLVLSGCTQEEPRDNEEANIPSPEQEQEEEQGDEEAEPNTEEDGEESQESEEVDTDQDEDMDKEVSEDWRDYSKKDKNIEIKYPGNWYYRRALTEELDNDYYLFVEFAATPDVFEGGATSTIQLIGADSDKEVEESEYSVVAEESGDKKFILRTNEESLKGIVDEMATTLEFLQENQ